MLIDDIEYVIFRHPDLSAVRHFMIDYGLLYAVQEGSSLYLRSYGDAPFSYVTTEGEAAFVGMGFRVSSQKDLIELAARFGADVEDCPHPGGGWYIHTTDPEGRRLEFVFGAARSVPVPSDDEPIAWDDAREQRRFGRFERSGQAPAQVQRLGHLAVFSPAPRQMIEWYGKNLGMRPSELIHDGNEANVMASFMHLDKGDAWTDYHTLAIVLGPAPGLDHVALECRHFHGSHNFDYWTDPAGFQVKHYADGDLVNQDSPTLRYPLGRDNLLQWGPAFPGL